MLRVFECFSIAQGQTEAAVVLVAFVGATHIVVVGFLASLLILSRAAAEAP